MYIFSTGVYIFNPVKLKSLKMLHITTIQTELFWEDKIANLNMFEEKIKNISTKKEIVILPEMFTTGFSMNAATLAEKMDGVTMQWMKRIC